jgi:outer membrane protein assembly factor BamD
MKLLFVATVLLILNACSTGHAPPAKSADVYYEEGERFFEKGRYVDAIASWEKVRDSFQSAELTTLAELKIADAYFQDGQFEEAILAYEEFLRQHPNHPQTATILFNLGSSYYRQRLSIDRDQTNTRQALSTFERLLQQFPDDPRGAETKDLVSKLHHRLADHELYVGRFYVRTKKTKAAIARLTSLLERYPDHSGRDESYFLLGKAYLLQGERDLAMDNFNALYEYFPDSNFVAKARKFQEKHYN